MYVHLNFVKSVSKWNMLINGLSEVLLYGTLKIGYIEME